MARKSTSRSTEIKEKYDPPKTLKEHPFFGLKLDEEQEAFRDAIWSDDYDAIFCNAKSGSGKTTIAIATAMLLCEYGKYSGVIYQVASGVHEYKQGLLPGSLEEKSAPLFAPLVQAVTRLGYDPQRVVANDSNILSQKDGSAIVVAQTNSYIRGISVGEVDTPVVYVLDEAQNYDVMGIVTAITRTNANSKLVVIGHNLQCDLKYKQDSGFVVMMNHFAKHDRCKVCTLSKNYRGWISAWADELQL